MSMKVSATITAENGPPLCESLVATCSLQFDDDSSPLQEPKSLQQAVGSAITVCCRAVQEELFNQRSEHRESD